MCDYHDAAVNKAKDEYYGQYDGYSTKEFSEPSEFIKYMKSVKEKDMKNASAGEYFLNLKKEYGISIGIGYDEYMNCWIVEASASNYYGG
ncbi:MAG: hypothetical protein MJ009_07615 [Paludibacteraceae bacterium]|nr:hypothetical protein [Paludibacteraceae bacterium]